MITNDKNDTNVKQPRSGERKITYSSRRSGHPSRSRVKKPYINVYVEDLYIFNIDKDYECSTVKIDANMIPEASQYVWHVDKRGYVTNGKLKLHSLIMQHSGHNTVVDHINGNTLDNRMANLRICSKRVNSINRHTKASRTGYTNVLRRSFTNRKPNYEAYMNINKQYHTLGRFKTASLAAVKVWMKGQELFGQDNPYKLPELIEIGD